MAKRLYRSRTDRMIGGVCGGLGEYFGVDPTLLRLAFVLVTLAGGAGILIYLVLLIVLPEKPQELPAGEGVPALTTEVTGTGASTEERVRNAMLLGVILILVGFVFLLRNLGINLFAWFRGDLVWPLLLILGGFLLIVRHLRS